MKRGKRIVMTSFGSLGDLHPYLAIGKELKSRGHDVVIATCEEYRARVEPLGLGFHPVRPRFDQFGDGSEFAKLVFDLRRGPEFMVREVVMANLRSSYEDLLPAARGADLIVSHPLTCAAPLLAEKEGLPWAATVLAPMSFLSPYDPPVIPPMPWLIALRGLGPVFFRPLFLAAQRSTWSWSDPVRELRHEIGLPASASDPLGAGQFSPYLNLGLYSPLLGAPQPDWPRNTVITGFPFFDGSNGAGRLAPELEEFLMTGAPPIVFTLGSAAVMDAGSFYRESALAAARLGRRAVLLVGSDPRNRAIQVPSKKIAVFDYAPYSEILPRAMAVVHQGGIGTTAQTLRAGRPMLVVPFAFDQPDNAARMKRIGVARTLARDQYTAQSAVRQLRALLESPPYVGRATEVGQIVRQETGAETACDALEALLQGSSARPLAERGCAAQDLAA
jgi:rhamnosyltransferase subunit B